MTDDICGQAWSLTGSTGTMAAALAQDALVFAMQATADASLATSPNAPRRAPIEIEGFRMVFTGIVASATPAAAGRALRLFRGTVDAAGMTFPTGGTALTAIAKNTLDAGADSGLAGVRISTTAGLTAGAFTRGTVPLATFDLVGVGSAGGRAEFEQFELVNGGPLFLAPGEILVVSNPAAFDALLTWQLTVNVDYRRRDSR